MPLRSHVKWTSVDDHVVEHPHVWQDRFPERFRSAGPSLIHPVGCEVAVMGKRLDAGRDVWVYEGNFFGRSS